MLDHCKGSEILTNGRSHKKIAHMTEIRREGGDYIIRYHTTDVVTQHADGTFTIRAGSWQSNTTKKRINDYSPAYVYQRGYTWYVATPQTFDNPKGEVLFKDGMKVDRAGVPITE